MKTNFSFRNAITAVAVISAGLTANAQAFQKGTTALNAGIGLGGYRYGYLSGYNSNYSVSPTMNLSAEHGVGELGDGVIGIGGFFGYKSVTYKNTSRSGNYTYNHDQKWSNTLIGMRASWHANGFFENEKLDLYGGVMLGYNIGNYKNRSTRTYNGVTSEYDNDYNYKLGFVTYGTYIGGRYFFTENIGAYMELGYGVSYLNLGVSLKM